MNKLRHEMRKIRAIKAKVSKIQRERFKNMVKDLDLRGTVEIFECQ